MPLLDLPSVTLCAATSVNVEATMAAIKASTDQVRFGDVVLFTDSRPQQSPGGVRVVQIAPLRSGADYSNFLLRELAGHIRTDHCLIIQWDGFVLDAEQWDPAFLEYDYIGAPWPQFDDGHDVGNGGFSLRSRRLLEACRCRGFICSHPEDVAIGRLNRDFLERECDILFANREMAARFACERSAPTGPTFGFHGVFNMIPLLGADKFWRIYRGLDERSSVFHDYRLLMRQLGTGRDAARRRLQLALDLLRSWTA
ncbi:MAG TPA: DUF5672 family protein [Sphingomicrobium sp.]|jgi:hypothetical protein|nr:DUF5672 family protein [Sphingomicrobium sp.]